MLALKISDVASIVRSTPVLFQYLRSNDDDQEVADIADSLGKTRLSVANLTAALDEGLSLSG